MTDLDWNSIVDQQSTRAWEWISVEWTNGIKARIRCSSFLSIALIDACFDGLINFRNC